jgi:hypothetical protein
VILFIKDDGCAGPLEWFPRICRWLHSIDLTRPLFKLAVRGVQGCTSVNAQGISGLLELLLAGFLFISFITPIIAFLLLTASGRFPLILRGLAGAASSATSALPASAILVSLFVTLLVLSLLLLDELLNLMTLLEIMALGPMDLAVRPVSLPSLLGSRGFPAISARGNFLAGSLGLGLLAGTRCAQSFNGHHCFILALLVRLLLVGGVAVVL